MNDVDMVNVIAAGVSLGIVLGGMVLAVGWFVWSVTGHVLDWLTRLAEVRIRAARAARAAR